MNVLTASFLGKERIYNLRRKPKVEHAHKKPLPIGEQHHAPFT